ETTFVLLLIAIFAGTVIDDLGMRIESRWLDEHRERRTGGLHGEEWWAYLRKPFPTEPSGRRHLRRLVARLKFGLGGPVGVLATAPALWLPGAQRPSGGAYDHPRGLSIGLFAHRSQSNARRAWKAAARIAQGGRDSLRDGVS